jgi:hypothetical protein
MTDEQARDAYLFAFRLGAVVSIVLFCVGVTGPTLAAFSALAVWAVVLLFVLPVTYAYAHRHALLTRVSIRAPHQ